MIHDDVITHTHLPYLGIILIVIEGHEIVRTHSRMTFHATSMAGTFFLTPLEKVKFPIPVWWSIHGRTSEGDSGCVSIINICSIHLQLDTVFTNRHYAKPHVRLLNRGHLEWGKLISYINTLKFSIAVVPSQRL